MTTNLGNVKAAVCARLVAWTVNYCPYWKLATKQALESQILNVATIAALNVPTDKSIIVPVC